MDVFLSWLGGARVPRLDLEDTIEEILGSRGEVTGGGSGEIGEHIDIEIFTAGAAAASPEAAGADAEGLLARIAAALAGAVPANASYCVAGDDGRHLLRELLPGYEQPSEQLRAAADGICAGFDQALKAASDGHPPFACHSGMVDGTTVITHLVGRLAVAEARERVRTWADGAATTLIRQPLNLVGATAWEAHYNGVPIVRIPTT
ncbi:hypothetical protein [Nonomuraea gerenzanensis]|uniref:hypothetical protein n=1 Tax=Nonomuraea gerenzanensis TaxID=93944 RepID=UPI001CD9E03D|nr:hypothetical protein [Nonomuraea gerenzanensis]UBU17270.1 hypothetical protein LCN96_20275 [Nonomuraea gerenzanensis]